MERPTLKLRKPPTIWCVWRIDTSRVKRSHETFEAANAEAERLADANPGKRYMVMQSVRSARRRPT